MPAQHEIKTRTNPKNVHTNLLSSIFNKGELVECFIGQELLAYADAIDRDQLFYWCGNASSAEVDYLIQQNENIVPIEVKAGKSLRIVSMYRFFETHPRSKYGLRFWTENENIENNIKSYPLYAIAKPLLSNNEYLKEALKSLCGESDNE